MKVKLIAGALMFLGVSDSAWAQTPPLGQPVPALTTQEQTRQGFTILASLGAGVQRDNGLEDSAIGLAGVNLGIGGFLTDRLAVMFRISGTNVKYELGGVSVRQVSGVAGGSLQYWLHPRLAVEGGAGVGYWDVDELSEQGLGLFLGVTGVLFSRGRHNVTAGIEYAPAFADPATVHNLGFVVGYQFVRR